MDIKIKCPLWSHDKQLAYINDILYYLHQNMMTKRFSIHLLEQSHPVHSPLHLSLYYLLEQSHPVHSPLQVQTDLPSTSTVQDPSFRQGLGEQGLTEIFFNIIS